jgi:hypothetical protein
MTHTPIRRIGRAASHLFAATALAAGLLASTASMAVAPGFDARMNSFIASVKSDPNYKRIPLAKTSDREWFYDLSNSVYEKKITKEQFVAEGAKQFPGYEASFSTVADYMTK